MAIRPNTAVGSSRGLFGIPEDFGLFGNAAPGTVPPLAAQAQSFAPPPPDATAAPLPAVGRADAPPLDAWASSQPLPGPGSIGGAVATPLNPSAAGAPGAMPRRDDGSGAFDPEQTKLYASELGVSLPGPHKFNWGRAALAFFGGTPIAAAYQRGDYATAATLNMRSQAMAAKRKESQAEEMRQLSIYSAMRHSGMTRDTALQAMSNLDAYGTNFNTRFKTDTMGEGQVRYQPNSDGSASTFVSPRLVQSGSEFAYVSPNSVAGPQGGAGGQGGVGGAPMLSPGAGASGAAPAGPAGGQQFQQQLDAAIESDPMLTSPMLKAAARADPQGYIQHLMQRYGSGQSAASPGGANAPAGGIYNAPSSLQRGAPLVSATGLNVAGMGSLRSDAERYADTLYPRGSQQWRTAVQDAVMKGNGPTAYGQETTLQGARLGVQMRGQDIDQGNNVRTVGATTRGQDMTDSRDRYIHSTPNDPVTPSRVIGGIMAKQAAGQPLTAGEQATFSQYQNRGRRGRLGGANPGGSDLVGQVYTRGGQRVQYSTAKGAYVDLTTGQPVHN